MANNISKPHTPFRIFRPSLPQTALGFAVAHLMTKPAFANLKFGNWSRILAGQINRGHYSFVVDATKNVHGFAGWGFVTRDKAEDWVEGRAGLSYQDCLQGECIVFNAWSATDFAVHRFMVDEARKLISGKQTMYFKRYYPDGSTRPVRLNVNDFVGKHIKRKSQNGQAADDGEAATHTPSGTLPN
ncbi:toxin-activating lysine-acyltransferase [Aestuariivirga sp.]|uniref:toxin-activating lysine-acyltransferase n=1 Tax=Aestuariivirga sp. TaxID=2650926 RepID=UPI00359329D2